MVQTKKNAVLTQRRTHVQAVSGLLRDPVLVEADELLNEVDQRFAVERLRGS
jgi:hypothetical protein